MGFGKGWLGSGSEEDEVKMASNRDIAVALEKPGLLKQDKIQVRRVAARAASGHTEESLSQALVEQGRRKDKRNLNVPSTEATNPNPNRLLIS